MLRKALGLALAISSTLLVSAVAAAEPPQTATPQFIPAEQVKTTNPALFYELSGTHERTNAVAAAVAPSWSNSLSCGVSLSAWNTYYGCAIHRNTSTPIAGNINTLYVSPLFTNQLYPVQTLLYVYNAAGALLGYLDLGYFQMTPQPKLFNVASIGLPMSSQFRYVFRINGGGSPSITNPPTVSSTYISVSQ